MLWINQYPKGYLNLGLKSRGIGCVEARITLIRDSLRRPSMVTDCQLLHMLMNIINEGLVREGAFFFNNQGS